ncbi:MAG: TROVE domain-containing protein, partial [Bacteroidota bacterium]
IQRADEITELLAYYQLANQRQGNKQLNRLSKQLQKGIAAAFNKFDAYQFAKYNRNAIVSLKDALFLAHPKAKDEAQQAIFDQIVSNTLEVPYTWEVKLSAWGQQSYRSEKDKAEALKEVWTELIQSNRLGYMALLRNLRNILRAGVSSTVINQVADRLADPEQVRRSKQLPFRFLSAYRELETIQNGQVAMLLDALEEAVRVSIYNLNGFDAGTRVLLASDVSSSMYAAINPKSKVRMYDIGLLMSMLLRERSRNVITGIFGDKWMSINLSSQAVLANTRKLESLEGEVGYSTNGHKVLKDLTKRGQVMDKVMFFTDLQMWDSFGNGNSLARAWKTYRKQVAPLAKLYLFDLAGHGQSPLRIKQNGVHLIAGWSDKIFEVMEAIEKGGDALATIKEVDL